MDAVADLGIRVTMEGGQQVAQQLDVIGAKGEAAGAKVSTSMKSAQSALQYFRETQRLTSADLDAAARRYDAMVASFNRGTESFYASRAGVVAHAQALEMDAAMAEKAATANQLHGLQLGRLNQELGTFFGRLTGANTAVTRLSAQIGGAVVGYGQMIAVLAAIAVAGKVWDDLTAKEKAAREEQEKLTKSAEEWAAAQARGLAGERTAQLDAETQKVRDLTAAYQKLLVQRVQSYVLGGLGTGQGSAQSGQIGKVNPFADQIAQAQTVIAALQADINKTITESALDEQRTHDEQLAHSVQYYAADAALREKALARVKDIEGQLAYLRAHHPDDLEDINRLNDALKLLNGALNPSAKHDLADYLKEIREVSRDTTSHLLRMKQAVDEIVNNYQFGKPGSGTTVSPFHVLEAFGTGRNTIIGNVTGTVTQDMAHAAVEGFQYVDKEAEKYADDMARIWRNGFDRIITDGTKSFHDFFEDVFRLFQNLMDRMEKEGKTSGAGFQALQLGTAAIGGGLIGYQSQNAGVGILGGAAMGAQFGAAGAAAGALGGFIGGIIGSGQAAREAAARMDALRQSITDTFQQLTDEIGDPSGLTSRIDAVAQQFAALRQQVDAAYPHSGLFAGQHFQADLDKKHADALAKANALEAERIRQLQEEARIQNQRAGEDYAVRAAKAAGFSGADDLALALQQQRELEDAVKKGFDENTIAQLKAAQAAERAQREREKQSGLLQQQADILQTQLDTAKQSADALRQLHDSLASFSSSLKTSDLSPLSPADRLQAAKAERDRLYALALGGDQAAAAQFQGAASTYLQASRSYNASSVGYVTDFTDTQRMVDTLATQFGNQADAQQQMVDLLTQQLALLKIEQDLLTKSSAAQIDAIVTQRDQLLHANGDVIDALAKVSGTLGDTGNAIVAAQKDLLIGNQNDLAKASQAEIDAINAGASIQQIAQLEQIRQLQAQKTATDDWFAKQILQQGQLLGFDSPTVKALIAQEAQYDAGLAAQINALGGINQAVLLVHGDLIALPDKLTPNDTNPWTIDFPQFGDQQVKANQPMVDAINAVGEEMRANVTVLQAGVQALSDRLDAISDNTSATATHTQRTYESMTLQQAVV